MRVNKWWITPIRLFLKIMTASIYPSIHPSIPPLKKKPPTPPSLKKTKRQIIETNYISENLVCKSIIQLKLKQWYLYETIIKYSIRTINITIIFTQIMFFENITYKNITRIKVLKKMLTYHIYSSASLLNQLWTVVFL